MLQDLLNKQPRKRMLKTARKEYSLQIVLWTIWTCAIAAVGYFSWHADIVAQRPINTLGLVIHCVVAGIIGLVILTKIEMHMQPWRFFGR